MPIESLDELRRWMEEVPQRHAPSGGGCSCGWQPFEVDGMPSVTYADHVSEGPIAELPDFLASQCYDGADRLSISAYERWLEETGDRNHEVIELLLDLIVEHVAGQSSTDRLAAAVCRIYPKSVWARAIRQLVEVDPSLATDIPGDL